MKRNIHLLIIDPQNDFCDLPDAWLPPDPLNGGLIRPALAVPGAHQDMLRLAKAIERGVDGLSDITLTLDMHHHVGIERPTFWRRGDGGPVAPFTTITEAQVRAGEYLPRNPRALPKVLQYLAALEKQARYALRVWTVHCEIGTWGAGVHEAVRRAYNLWEQRHQAVVNKLTKGSNPGTEHYSPFRAEVIDPNDPSTQLNTAAIDAIAAADLTFVAGEAESHCLKGAVLDLVDNFGGQSLSKIVLVRDAMSPVPGFEKETLDFRRDMEARGLRTCTADEMAAELIANARR